MKDQESQQNEMLESRLEDSMADDNEPTVTPSKSASPTEGVSAPRPAFEIYRGLSTASSRSQDYKGHQGFSSYWQRGLFPQGSGSGSQATVQTAFQQTGTSLSQFLHPSQGQTSFNGVQGIQGQQYRDPLRPFPFRQETPSQGEHAQQQNLTAAGRLFPQPLQGSTPGASAVPPPPALFTGEHHARSEEHTSELQS